MTSPLSSASARRHRTVTWLRSELFANLLYSSSFEMGSGCRGAQAWLDAWRTRGWLCRLSISSKQAYDVCLPVRLRRRTSGWRHPARQDRKVGIHVVTSSHTVCPSRCTLGQGQIKPGFQQAHHCAQGRRQPLQRPAHQHTGHSGAGLAGNGQMKLRTRPRQPVFRQFSVDRVRVRLPRCDLAGKRFNSCSLS